MRLFGGFVLVAILCACIPQAQANLCNEKHVEARHTLEARAAALEAFSRGYSGQSIPYDERIIACNRKRDSNGNEIEDRLPLPSQDFPKELEPRTVKGHLNYYGAYAARMRYAYQLSRKNFEWIVTVPIEFHWPSSHMTDMIDIPFELAINLGLDQAGRVCEPGATVYKESNPRQVEKGFIGWQLGAPQLRVFRVDSGDERVRGRADINKSAVLSETLITKGYDVVYARGESSCRVPRLYELDDPSTTRTDKMTILRHLRAFWKRNIRTVWNRPGFIIRPLFVECANQGACDEVEENRLRTWKKDKTIWQVHFNLFPMQRAAYKRIVGKWNNIYTGSASWVVAHEFGHQLGLDDEYGTSENGQNACENIRPDAVNNYIMCGGSVGKAGAQGVYAWIVTRRYHVAKEFRCKETRDCGRDEFCAKNGLKARRCEERRGPGAVCGSRDDKCARGLVCAGKPAGKCVRPHSVAVGRACIRDVQCVSDLCGTTNRLCQCKVNADCDNGYCDTGTLTVGKNRCVPYKRYGDHCSADKQCLPPNSCLGKPLGRCATENSRSMGEACIRDKQCRLGRCGSNNRCVCTEDWHCTRGICKKPIGRPNYCKSQ